MGSAKETPALAAASAAAAAGSVPASMGTRSGGASAAAMPDRAEARAAREGSRNATMVSKSDPGDQRSARVDLSMGRARSGDLAGAPQAMRPDQRCQEPEEAGPDRVAGPRASAAHARAVASDELVGAGQRSVELCRIAAARLRELGFSAASSAERLRQFLHQIAGGVLLGKITADGDEQVGLAVPLAY